MREKKKILVFVLLLCGVIILAIFFAYQIKNGVKTEVSEDVVVSEEEKPMSIHFLDIGQGDATLIDFPNGEQMLIDCAKNTVVIEALGRVMSVFDRDIDYMLITNPDLDHYGGCIDVLKRFHVKQIIHNGFNKKDSRWEAFLAEAELETREGGSIMITTSTSGWDVGAARIDILYPDHDIAIDPRVPSSTKKTSVNDTSIVTKISYGSQDILFPGDAESEEERYLVKKYGSALDVEVVKLAHHCSQTSSIQEFIDRASPHTVVCSVGKDNSYGHPHYRIIRRLEKSGARIWRTDLNGDILMTVTKDAIESTPTRVP